MCWHLYFYTVLLLPVGGFCKIVFQTLAVVATGLTLKTDCQCDEITNRPCFIRRKKLVTGSSTQKIFSHFTLNPFVATIG